MSSTNSNRLPKTCKQCGRSFLGRAREKGGCENSRAFCSKQCSGAYHHREVVDDERQLRRCCGCGEWKPFSAFHRHIDARPNPRCKPCARAHAKSWSDETKDKIRSRWIKRRSQIEDKLKYLLNAARQRAIKQNLPFDLDLKFLIGLWKKQNGVCPYTGLVMTNVVGLGKKTKRAPVNLSLDKVIPEIGYVRGNVVFCTVIANKMKLDLSIEEFIGFAECIGDRAEEIEECLTDILRFATPSSKRKA